MVLIYIFPLFLIWMFLGFRSLKIGSLLVFSQLFYHPFYNLSSSFQVLDLFFPQVVRYFFLYFEITLLFASKAFSSMYPFFRAHSKKSWRTFAAIGMNFFPPPSSTT